MAAKRHGSLTALRLAQRKRFARVLDSQREVHREFAEGGLRDFREQTSGGTSAKRLRAMGHPFGRVGGQGSPTIGRGIVKRREAFRGQGAVTKKAVLPPLPINVQTGRLRRAIQLRGPKGRLLTYELYSDAPHAAYVLSPEGTSKMVARGLLGERGLLRRRHRARAAALIDEVRARQRD